MVQKKEALVLGFALFAMFFGAGNLIFPPSLGVNAGVDWLIPGIGFLVTGVGLPLLGILSFVKCRQLDRFSDKVSPLFNTIFCSVLILTIGPFFALPRTGSTTFEMAVQPLMGGAAPFWTNVVTCVIFFGITYLLTIKESKITDIIGKYITPIILVILVIIFFRGFTTAIGEPVASKISTNIFTYGFVNGYQTMDALASVLFGVVIISGMEGKGITDSKMQSAYLTQAGIIAALGLGLIYLFLIYFGSKISGAELGTTTSAALFLAEKTLGEVGRSFFGICVGAACLTTAVGLAALTADWFSRLTKMSYHSLLIITCLFSTGVAIGGVDMIIQLSIPILLLLYPITIVLIVMNLLNLNALAFKFGTYTTIVISMIEVIGSTFKVTVFQNIIAQIPLGSIGFAWLLPFIISVGVAYLCSLKKNKA